MKAASKQRNAAKAATTAKHEKEAERSWAIRLWSSFWTDQAIAKAVSEASIPARTTALMVTSFVSCPFVTTLLFLHWCILSPLTCSLLDVCSCTSISFCDLLVGSQGDQHNPQFPLPFAPLRFAAVFVVRSMMM